MRVKLASVFRRQLEHIGMECCNGSAALLWSMLLLTGWIRVHGQSWQEAEDQARASC